MYIVTAILLERLKAHPSSNSEQRQRTWMWE